MSIYDQDTDPSSPEARATGARRTGTTPEPPGAADASSTRPPSPSPRAATTDPGVGPPVSSAPRVLRGQAVVVPPPSSMRGVPVAATAPAQRPKDSVELLLEGMAGPRPDRTKTMPQTSGEAAAAYHAEHAVRAGQSPRTDEARKVLVDTLRVPVAKPLEEDTGPLYPKLAARADPTYVVPARLGPRVVLAAVAGLAVVVLIFLAFDRPAGPGAPAVSSPTRAPVPAAPGPEVQPPAMHAEAPGAAAVPPAAENPPVAPATAVPPTVASRAHARHAGAASAQGKTGGEADVGEFKTSF